MKPIAAIAITLCSTIRELSPANEHYKSHFTSPEFKNTVWSFPSAPSSPVTCFPGQAGRPFLVKVGVSCEFKAYPGLGHSIINKEPRYLKSWIKTRMPGS